jgi:hypothetical protein
VNDATTHALVGPRAVEVITMTCAGCDARSTVPVTDPLKAQVVQLFRAAHTGHRPTVVFGGSPQL